MFEELKNAWQDAVSNFWEEVNADAGDPGDRLGSMESEVRHARGELKALEGELADSRKRLGKERHELEVCNRRAGQADRIGDEETARVAREFATRHRERIGVLEQKVAVLRAERDLWRRDLDRMETALENTRVEMGRVTPGAERSGTGSPELDELDDLGRQRAAEARLEELKRRMGRG